MFADDGIAFDPTRAAPPSHPASIEQAVPGGQGLVLVRKLAQSIAYERVAGRNRLTVSLAL